MYGNGCRTPCEPNQRHGAEDGEGEAAEQEQKDADGGDRRFVVGRSVIGEALIERQADASDEERQQDPEDRRPPPPS